VQTPPEALRAVSCWGESSVPESAGASGKPARDQPERGSLWQPARGAAKWAERGHVSVRSPVKLGWRLGSPL
jgi:hypothetical protein